MKKKKIIFTGGHHNSTLVVALSARKTGYQVVWIGHKFATQGSKSFLLSTKKSPNKKFLF